MKPLKATPKSQPRGVVFEEVLSIDLEEDDTPSEPKKKISLAKESKYVFAISGLIFRHCYWDYCIYATYNQTIIVFFLAFLF